MAKRWGSLSLPISSFNLIRHGYFHLPSPIFSRQLAEATHMYSSNMALVRPTPSPPISAICSRAFLRRFSSSPDSQSIHNVNIPKEEKKKVNTKVNFSLSDSEDNDDDDDGGNTVAMKDAFKPKLPPPYDPFNKNTGIEEPEDPKDLQTIFHKMRTEGLTNSAVKMFDGLSKDGLTHEALNLFSQIKEKGYMPDVVAHTAVIEVYADAGQPKEALKVFLRMLACGVAPNAYTYSVLIKGLALDPKTLGEAKKYLIEMMDKGMRPNAATYAAVFEAFVRDRKEDAAKELLQQMKDKGFVPDEKAVREVLHIKRGHAFRTVINLLFNK